MKQLIIIFCVALSIGMIGCDKPVNLKKGDRFLLQYGGSVDTFTIKGNNLKGYYCAPDWSNTATYFFDNEDLNSKTFKKL